MSGEHIGSTLESFLAEEGLLEEVTTAATLRVVAWQIAQDLARLNLSKAELARRMDTSRSQVDRLLRADGTDVKVSTLERAARVLDRRLKIELV